MTRGDTIQAQPPDAPSPVDGLMQAASAELAAARYFEAASLAASALSRARAQADFDRMARIALPLQEARRNIRMAAVDASRPTGHARLIRGGDEVPQPLRPGCYLLQPPLIGADAAALRLAADKSRVPMFILTREPLTRAGLWPIVGVGRISTRARIAPPAPLDRDERSLTKDAFGPLNPIPLQWFEAAGEALGDAAIARVPAELHPVWRVDALVELIEACPMHEKLYQALGEACRAADRADPPADTRPPDWAHDDLFGFDPKPKPKAP